MKIAIHNFNLPGNNIRTRRPPLMKKKPTKTEEANIELNKAFYGEEQKEPDLDPLINNNNIALVLNDSKNNDKDNEDM